MAMGRKEGGADGWMDGWEQRTREFLIGRLMMWLWLWLWYLDGWMDGCIYVCAGAKWSGGKMRNTNVKSHVS